MKTDWREHALPDFKIQSKKKKKRFSLKLQLREHGIDINIDKQINETEQKQAHTNMMQ